MNKLLYFILLFTAILLAQREVDSLISIIPHFKGEKYFANLEKVVRHLNVSNPTKCIGLIEKELNQPTFQTNELRKAEFLNLLGCAYKNMGNQGLSLENHLKALSIFTNNKDSISISDTYLLLSDCYKNFNDVENSIGYLNRAIEILKVKPNEKNEKIAGSKVEETSFLGNNLWLLHSMIPLILLTTVTFYYLKERKTRKMLTLKNDENIRKNEEFMRLNTELHSARESARSAEKLKGEFLAQISHEIRTPINTVINGSNLIQQELSGESFDQMKESFDVITRAGSRIIRTIDMILNMSKLQAGTYEFEAKELDLYNDVVEELYLNYKFKAVMKNVNIKMIKDCDDTRMVGDEFTIVQIFSNLFDNAVKYTPVGEIIIKIFKDGKNRLSVSVKDTGIGIGDEYIPKLFKPFSQENTGSTREFQGNGLGLALVQNYCQLNNAEIFVDSRKNFGTEFIVIFN